MSARITVMQGEARVSADAEAVMTTVLGSCVATCLFDPVARIGGMNHFLLAEPSGGPSDTASDRNYGLYLMELLINEMTKIGANKSRIKARLYGGANLHNNLARIGTANAAFARRFLKDEGIALAFEDLEGSSARRVDFRPASGMVRARTINDAVPIPSAPTRYPEGKPQSDLGSVELF